MSDFIEAKDILTERLDEIQNDLNSTTEEVVNLKAELAKVAGELSVVVEQIKTLL